MSRYLPMAAALLALPHLLAIAAARNDAAVHAVAAHALAPAQLACAAQYDRIAPNKRHSERAGGPGRYYLQR
ncbi:MAG: hypothetical protein ACREP7_11610 [Lysobacter sp.]